MTNHIMYIEEFHPEGDGDNINYSPLFEYVYTNWFSPDLVSYNHETGLLELAGLDIKHNMDIILALQRQEHCYNMFWQSTHRDGRIVFELRGRTRDEFEKYVMQPKPDIPDIEVESVSVAGNSVDAFIGELISFYDKCGGENYVSFTVNRSDGSKKYEITIVDKTGEITPTEKIAELEATVEQLKLENQNLRDLVVNKERYYKIEMSGYSQFVVRGLQAVYKHLDMVSSVELRHDDISELTDPFSEHATIPIRNKITWDVVGYVSVTDIFK